MLFNIKKLNERCSIRREILSEGVLSDLFIYGPIDSFFIWIEKLFSIRIVKNMKNLIKQLTDIFLEFDNLGKNFSKTYISKFELREIISSSIDICRKIDTTTNPELSSKVQIGSCIINKFFLFINKVFKAILFEYMILLLNEKINITQIRTVKDLIDIELSPDFKYKKLSILIKDAYNSYLNLLSSDDFNYIFTVISKLHRGIVSADLKYDLTQELNAFVMKIINVFGSNVEKLSTFVWKGDVLDL